MSFRLDSSAPAILAALGIDESSALVAEDMVEELDARFRYDRKGYWEHDGFGYHRNPTYSSASDDIIIDLKVRIPSYMAEQHTALAKVHEAEFADRKAADIAAAKAKLAAAQAELDALEN